MYLRGLTPLPDEAFPPVIFALSELLQSPDEELLGDACVALLNVCEGNARNVQRVLEHGLLGRIREMCEAPAVRESAVLVLCTLAR